MHVSKCTFWRLLEKEKKRKSFYDYSDLMLSKIHLITIASIFHSLEAFNIVLYMYIFIYMYI